MKTTVRAVLINLDPEKEATLKHLQTLFSSAIRFAYQRIQEGREKKDIQKMIQAKYGLNSRYASDAIEQARQTKVAQEELLNLQIENWQKKVKAVAKRIEKIKKLAKPKDAKSANEPTNPKIINSPKVNKEPKESKGTKESEESKLSKKLDQLPGLRAKLAKREKKLAYWIKFKESKTLPKVIFGGRKNFIDRCQGKISSAEWKALRDNRVVSRGDVNKKGNPNTRLIKEKDKTYLIINTDQYEKRGKAKRYIQIKAEIYLPWKPSKKTGAINGRNYRQMILDCVSAGQAYQVEIIQKNKHYYCHITVEEAEPKAIFNNYNGLEGIDTNPDGLALTLISKDGNFKESCWFGDGELCNASSNRRSHIIGKIARQAVAKAKEHGVAIVIEDLKFKDDRDLRAKIARKIHQFTYSKLLQSIEREAIREAVGIIKVNPAYTSMVGKYKYQRQFGLTVHQAAAMVIARRGYGFKDKLPKAVKGILPNKTKESYQHHWSKWHVANKVILKIAKLAKLAKSTKIIKERKAGKPAFSVT